MLPPLDILRPGLMIIGIIYLALLAVVVLKFIEWWFHRRDKGE